VSKRVTASSPVAGGAVRWLFFALLLWTVGVQTNESIASLGLIATILGVGARWAAEPDRRGLVDLLRQWWPLALFLGWAVGAPALAGRLPTGAGLSRALDWLGVPFAACAVRALPLRHLKAIAVVGAAVFLLSCALAALQHVGAWPSLTWFDRLSWTRIPFYRVYEPVPESNGHFMAGGLLFHRLKFAHVGGLSVLGSLVLGLVVRSRMCAFWLATAAIGFVSVLLFPYARAASAALVLSACVPFALIGLRSGRGRLIVVAFAAVTLAGVSAYRPTRDRFLGALTATGSGDRREILSTGARAVREHPIVGVGLGQFRPSYFGSATTPQHVIDNPGKAHNEFLSIAAETGVPGLMLFILLLGFLARSFSPRRALGVLGFSALAFFVILSLAHDPLIHAPFSMALSLSLGVAAARAPMSRRKCIPRNAMRATAA
jgi:O-antigen ligase